MTTSFTTTFPGSTRSMMQYPLEDHPSFNMSFGASGRGAPVDETRLLDGSYDIQKLTIEQLQFELQRRGLDTTGTKAMLKDRFLDYLLCKLRWRVGTLVSDAKRRRDCVSKEQSGSVYATGLHAHGTDETITTFTPIPELLGCQPVEVAAGDDFALVLTQPGEVFAWGRVDAPIFSLKNATNSATTRTNTGITAAPTLHTSRSFRSRAPSGGDVLSPTRGVRAESFYSAAGPSSPLLSSHLPSSPLLSSRVERESMLRTPKQSFVWGDTTQRSMPSAASTPRWQTEAATIAEMTRTRAPTAVGESVGTGLFRRPHAVQGLAGENAASVRAGHGYAAVVSATDDIFMWGRGHLAHERLTHDPASTVQSIPAHILPFDTMGTHDIQFGGLHAFLKDADGTLHSWGLNRNGCLGLSAAAVGADADEMGDITHARPQPIPFLMANSLRVTHISCSNMHVVIGVDSGVHTAFSWGRGDGFRLGHGDTLDRSEPTPITQLTGLRVRSVLAVASRSFAVTESTSVGDDGLAPRTQCWAWGIGAHGQLGLGRDMVQVHEPTPIISFMKNNIQIESMAGSSTHTAAIAENGELYVWGTNKYGALGVEATDTMLAVFEPAKVLHINCLIDGVGRGKARSVACGQYFTVVACHPFEVTTTSRVAEHNAFLESAEAVARLRQYEKMQEDEAKRKEEERNRIIAENREKFRAAQPCTLCDACPGYVHDDISPTLCMQCGHLRSRHNIGSIATT